MRATRERWALLQGTPIVVNFNVPADHGYVPSVGAVTSTPTPLVGD